MKIYDLRVQVDGNNNVLKIADITVDGFVRQLDLPSWEWGSALLDMIAGCVGERVDIADILSKLEKRVNNVEAMIEGHHNRIMNVESWRYDK